MSFVVGTVLGASIAGFFTVLLAVLQRHAQKTDARIERERSRHDELVVASVEYLQALDNFIWSMLRTPPMLVRDPEKFFRTGNFRFLIFVLTWQLGLAARMGDYSGAEFQGNRRKMYSASARLLLVAPAEVVQAIDDVERFITRWRKTPTFEVADEWPTSLRPKVIETFRKACWAAPS